MATATKIDDQTVEAWVPGRFETKKIPGSVTLTLTLEEAGVVRTLTGNVTTDKYETDAPRKLSDEVWSALSKAGVSAVGSLTRAPMFK